MQLTDGPVPIWVVEGTSKPSGNDGPVDDLFGKLITEEGTMPEYRGVEISRLGRVLTTGVDVEPTNAPIYVSDIDKAWEYPDWTSPRVVFALRSKKLKRSWQTLPLDATPEEIANVKQDYPHMSETESSLRFSRFAEQHRNLAYEAAYGYWIPDNAKDALAAIFLFGDDTKEVFTSAKKALEEWRDSMPADAGTVHD